jgi:hypothetical protein
MNPLFLAVTFGVVTVGFASTAILTRLPSRRKLAVATLFWTTALGLFILGLSSWFFRDGLAPGMLVSSGGEAWRRFLSDYWLGALVASIPLVAALIFSRIPLPWDSE